MGNYATAAEVTAEGATASTTRIDSRIVKWEAIVEEITRNLFYVVEPGELIFDGNNSDMLHFSLPLVEVTSLFINNDAIELAADEYRAFVGRQRPQDDRQNPKIQLTGNRANSIYTRNHGIFYKDMDQKLTAKWGFVDEPTSGTYTTPPAITAAVIELVCLDLDGYFDSAGSAGVMSGMRRERTDGHEVEYQDVEKARPTWSLLPQSVADILALYRCPWKMASPDNRRYTYGSSALAVMSF